MLLTVPVEDTAENAVLYPTLGPQVVAWIEAHLVHGPGDLRGQPVRLDEEKQFLIHRMYEIFPPGHPRAGKRRFKRVHISQRKGTSKTELAALIAAAELSETAPVRCVGWDEVRDDAGNFVAWIPIGGPVDDPYIPMVAAAQEQSEELAYGALRTILELAVETGRLAPTLFDIGLERVARARGGGKAVPLAAAPNSRDGARTTFQHFDEAHRLFSPRLVKAHSVMLANIPKRPAADGWTLETTTAFAPGEGSIAESAMEYAKQILRGEHDDSTLFFYHLQASEDCDLTTREGLREAVIEASGWAAEWSDIDAIVGLLEDPSGDRNYNERVWLNMPRRTAGHAFDLQRWLALRRTPHGYRPADRSLIVLGFQGARYADAAVLVGTELLTGFQWTVRAWEPKRTSDGKVPASWEVPVDEVSAAIAQAFARWDVWRLYAMPAHWETQVAEWSAAYDLEKRDRVVAWRTNEWTRMAFACAAFRNAIAAGELSHDEAPGSVLARHIGAACRRDLQQREAEEGKGRPWVIQKESPDSTAPINGAVAAVMSWQARRDAIEHGAAKPKKRSKYEDGELMVLDMGGA